MFYNFLSEGDVEIENVIGDVGIVMLFMLGSG